MKRVVPVLVLVLLAAALAGCPREDPAEGIYVGNPGLTTLRIGAVAGAEVADQGFAADSLVFTSCDGDHTDDVDLSEGLLDGDEFEIPSGPWCTVVAHKATLVIDAQVEAEGNGDDDDDDDGDLLTLWLEFEEIALSGATTDGFAVDADGTYVYELARDGWLDADDLDFGDEGELEIAPGHEDHDAIAELVADQTVLFDDPDGDGDLSDDERADGSLADADEPVAPSDPDDDGDGAPSCSGASASVAAGSAGASALLVLALAFVRRRRP